MLKPYIAKLIEKIDLTENEAEQAMNIIMSGNATQAQIGGFVTALRMKGEKIDEITGFARVMRQRSERVNPDTDFCLDTCGTGGDCMNTFNVSTAVMFIVAAAGIPIAKHGNRSVSSRCGSADVLEALGCRIDLEPDKVEECINKIGIGFMFAPKFHKSMSYAAGPRKELGIRTVFNILGPLTNPANAQGQLMGVFKHELVEVMSQVLARLGTQRALVVHGEDGIDEISIGGKTFVSELIDGKIRNYFICPEDFGIRTVDISEIKGGDKDYNAQIIRNILKGGKGHQRDVVALNAGAALYVGEKAKDITEGVRLAQEVIDSGAAFKKLNDLISITNRLAG